MDFIFEDDIDEVGSDIEAYCPKCKQDTSHTVITKYEEEVRRVQCSVCGDVHAYRKPRGEVEEEPPEPAAARKRAAAKKLSWQEFINKIGPNKANDRSRPYTIRDHYHEGDIVSHPKFGIGFVTEISENKADCPAALFSMAVRASAASFAITDRSLASKARHSGHRSRIIWCKTL